MWNPDLMLLLIEPTMYLLLGLAEQAGIPSPVLYRGEENEPDDTEEQLTGLENAIEAAKEKVIPKAEKGHLPKDIEQKLETFDPPEQVSLLASNRVEEDTSPSLLDKGTR